MKEVNEIRSQIGDLCANIREAEKRLVQAGLRQLGLKIGDRIKTGNTVVEITGCETRDGDPRPTGVKVKKDGTAGAQSAGYIYRKDWVKL